MLYCCHYRATMPAFLRIIKGMHTHTHTTSEEERREVVFLSQEVRGYWTYTHTRANDQTSHYNTVVPSLHGK